MNRSPALALIALISALIASPAAAEEVPASAIDAVSVTTSGGTITVEGVATLADASDAVVGTDASGDARLNTAAGPVPLSGLGMDLTSARIQHDAGGNRLIFTLGIADPMDQTFTIPELVGYHWLIKVTNGDSSIYYQLQAMRSGQYERTLPSADPLFRVNSCGSLASGAPNCFEVAGYVEGAMSGGIVRWYVPQALIGAFDGAKIEQSASGQVRSLFSASGAAYVGGHGDTIETVPYVVGPSVHVGIRRSTADPESTVYNLAATGPDGTFVGKLATPKSSGSYVVSARACHGDSRGCAVATSPLQV